MILKETIASKLILQNFLLKNMTSSYLYLVNVIFSPTNLQSKFKIKFLKSLLCFPYIIFTLKFIKFIDSKLIFILATRNFEMQSQNTLFSICSTIDIK